MENIVTNAAVWGALLLFSSSVIIAGWNVRSAKLGATDKLVAGFAKLNSEYRLEVEKLRRELSDMESHLDNVTADYETAKAECSRDLQEVEARYITIIAKMETKLQLKDVELKDALEEIEKLRKRVKFLEDKLGTGELNK